MPLSRSTAPSRRLAHFEHAVNAAGLVLWTCDTVGRCTYVSPNWTALTGHPLRQVLGDGWQRFIHPEDLAQAMPVFRSALDQHHPVTVEYRLRRRDGTLLWVRDHGEPVRDGGKFTGYVGTLLEIDERKRLEESAREASERFALASRGTRDGIWDWDLLTHAFYATQRCQEIVGYTRETLDDQPNLIRYVHPRDRAAVTHSIEQHLTNRTPHDVEYRWRMPHGRYRWMRSRGQAVWDENGRPVRMAGSTGDITDRKRAEQRVAQLNRRLTESNAALVGQSEMLQTLAQRLIEVGEQERSRIARDLHDDLIQKLAYLQMQTALLGQASPSLRQPLGELELLAEQIVEDVRRIARDLHSSMLDHLGLERALRSYCADFSFRNKFAVKFRRQGVVTEPASSVALCLYRVAQEALRNAARHSGAAGATVTLVGSPSTLLMRVEDKGAGFVPQSAGNGLGLTSMSERVRLAGGLFRLVTRPTKGTLVEASLTWSPTAN